MKDPDKVKAGKARWYGVPVKERRRLARKNGKKGAAALWKKVREGTLNFASK